ncbi:RabGAP/TBC domain-containing protein [Histomonas meleagridis]|uniref:RabGAP/TBC domain-containing protein n=1 Tax=Histomonas meleagridis TaxID=135588 RepID=UPI00355A8DC8|nr:RabGAP/TBC domain-containing protein [Histomonas meleagridis]KAH0803924.1 RabGAP/TBC domain-containing protein [Histomonas meleagridis]
MAFVDSTLNVSLKEGSEKKSGLLKLQFGSGSLSLSFFPEQLITVGNDEKRRIAQIPEFVQQLSDFTILRVDPNDSLNITLVGSCSKYCICFQNNTDSNTFLDCIFQKVQLEHSKYDPDLFLINSLDTPSQSYIVPILPRICSNRVHISLSDVQSQNLFFTLSSKVRQISKDYFLSLLNSEGKVANMSEFPEILFNSSVDYDVLPQLWKFILYDGYAVMTADERNEFDGKKRSLYRTVKKQWETTTTNQWHNSPELRSLVKTLERDLRAHSSIFEKYSSPKCVQRITFNVFLTLSFYNWDNASYVPGLVELLTPFLDSFIKDANGESVFMPNNETLGIEDIEADIFTVFNLFYEKNKISSLIRHSSKQPLLKLQMFADINDILQKDFPTLLQLLNQKHAYSLDFMRGDCEKWFATCFEGEDLMRLWISSASSADSIEFMKSFIVSMLYSLAPMLIEMNSLNNEEMVRMYQKEKTKFDLNVLLHNTKEMLLKNK